VVLGLDQRLAQPVQAGLAHLDHPGLLQIAEVLSHRLRARGRRGALGGPGGGGLVGRPATSSGGRPGRGGRAGLGQQGDEQEGRGHCSLSISSSSSGSYSGGSPSSSPVSSRWVLPRSATTMANVCSLV